MFVVYFLDRNENLVQLFLMTNKTTKLCRYISTKKYGFGYEQIFLQ